MRAAALRKLFSLAQNDPRILLAVSDVAAEILAPFKENMPQRLFVEGIAENHLVGMAAGLSKKNNVVFINTIASFLSKRAFEAIAVNLCLENANVKMLAQGGGLVYGEQGSTHHALEDISIMRSLPNMTVIAPCDTHQTEQAVELATKILGPVYIRLSKGSFPVISSSHTLAVGEPICFSKPGRIAFISTGITTQTALEASALFPESGVINIPILKPFPEQKVLALINSCELVV
ncbi:MAG: transketolase, partial [Patescibacteria group bacterium]